MRFMQSSSGVKSQVYGILTLARLDSLLSERFAGDLVPVHFCAPRCLDLSSSYGFVLLGCSALLDLHRLVPLCSQATSPDHTASHK